MSTPAKTAGKILVVDDDAAMRETLRDLLEAEGYAIIEASDGPRRRSELRSKSRDLS